MTTEKDMASAEHKLTLSMCGPRDCEHKWDGPEVLFENGGSVSCSKCGMLAIDHAIWEGP
jgi:hypothetical protein